MVEKHRVGYFFIGILIDGELKPCALGSGPYFHWSKHDAEFHREKHFRDCSTTSDFWESYKIYRITENGVVEDE